MPAPLTHQSPYSPICKVPKLAVRRSIPNTDTFVATECGKTWGVLRLWLICTKLFQFEWNMYILVTFYCGWHKLYAFSTNHVSIKRVHFCSDRMSSSQITTKRIIHWFERLGVKNILLHIEGFVLEKSNAYISCPESS